MGKYGKQLLCLFVLGILMTGCGQKLPEVIEERTIAIDKEGGITSYVVESFDKSYYMISELSEMAMSEAAEYNLHHGSSEEADPVKVEKVEILPEGEERAMITYHFSDSEVYTDYNEGILFYGTVSEAMQEGYSMNVPLTQVKDGALADFNDIKDFEERKVIITDEKAHIYSPKKVTHVSEGVAVLKDGCADTNMVDGLFYLLLKK